MSVNNFGDTCLVIYDEHEAYMQIQYTGKKPTQPRRLTAGALPILLFQLVDCGYSIMQEDKQGDMRVLRAYSETLVDELERQGGAK